MGTTSAAEKFATHQRIVRIVGWLRDQYAGSMARLDKMMGANIRHDLSARVDFGVELRLNLEKQSTDAICCEASCISHLVKRLSDGKR